MSGGWIKVHRKILDNDWLSKNRVYSNFEAFMYLLLKANHKEGFFHIGTQIVEVKRGQIVTSQKKLCKQFNWSNSKLRNYLKTAKNASMIHTETTSKTTTLTILNYDSYQSEGTELTLNKNQINTEKALKKHTNKNVKKNKEKNSMSDSFDIWWNLYDFKVGRSKCEKIWSRLSKKNIDAIMKHTPDYVKSTTKEEIHGGAFKPKRKHPQTYLYNKSWNDEIIKDNLVQRFSVKDFQDDHSSGATKIGYCSKCGVSDFYSPNEVVMADSRCCKVKVLPYREVVNEKG